MNKTINNDAANIIRQVKVSYPKKKMEGIPAITTSCMDNPWCAQRAKDPDSICAHCYAAKGLKRFKNARLMYHANGELLTRGPLQPYQIPIINASIARFETHGDLVNVEHARNYIRICEMNRWCTFALFTKNPGLIQRAVNEMGKPENLLVVYSSPMLNRVSESYRWYPVIDKVFTVYDAAGAEEQGITINCGAKHCNTCRKCYSKNDPDFFIYEALK